MSWDSKLSVNEQDQRTYENAAEARRVLTVDESGNYATQGLSVDNAIDSLAFDLSAAAFNATTSITNDFIFDSILLNFSTAESKTITITGVDGTILWGGSVDTSSDNKGYATTAKNFNLCFGQAFNTGDNITVDITQTSGACSCDVILKVTQGSVPLTGNPVIAAGTSSIGTVGLDTGTNSIGKITDVTGISKNTTNGMTAFMVSDEENQNLLENILTELKKNNLYLAKIANIIITDNEVI